MQAATAGVVWCCRRRPWLLKYNIYVMVKPLWTQRFAEHFCFSLRSSAHSAVDIEMIPAPLVLQSSASLHLSWIRCSDSAGADNRAGGVAGGAGEEMQHRNIVSVVATLLN